AIAFWSPVMSDTSPYQPAPEDIPPFGKYSDGERFRETASPFEAPRPDAVANETTTWAIVLHLSQFANFILPPAGFVAPILIWLLRRDALPGIDAHGREVANWTLSYLIYLLVAGLLCIVLIGVPIVIVLAVLGSVFPIIGAIHASHGRCWRYPLTIRFF
ncbi:MAG: DUF4870 domain-containing protein, partial [Planctomycetota bacterium]